MPPAPPAPSEMNGLVYQYLVAAGLSSTAKKFKKEAAFSGTSDDCDHSLVDIFHFYRTHRAQLDDADADSPAKKRRKLTNGESEKVNDVVEEEQKEVAKPQVDVDSNATAKKSKKKNKTKKKDKSKKESTKIKEPVESLPTEKKAKKSKKSKKKDKKEKKAAKEVAEAPVVESESQNDGEESSTTSTPAADAGPSETETQADGDDAGAEGDAAKSTDADEDSKKKGKKRRRSAPAPNAPFQRVKPLEVVEPWQDNSYNPVSSYGAKAFADLVVTRGKGFRHEKTKKKRGSYRGGTISMASNSYKF